MAIDFGATDWELVAAWALAGGIATNCDGDDAWDAMTTDPMEMQRGERRRGPALTSP